MIKNLEAFGHHIDVHDPLADPDDAQRHLGIKLLPNLSQASAYNCMIGAVAHQPYLQLTAADFKQLLVPKGLIADIKNMWRQTKLPEGLSYWTL